jgi:apolipoprotein N-acyltransferase
LKKTFIILLVYLLFFTSTYLYSIKFANVQNGKKKVTIALFQGNYPQSWETRKSMVSMILNSYVFQTRKAYKEKKFDLAIWPEYAIPGDPFTNKSIYDTLSKLADDLNIYLVTGCSPWVFNHKRYNNLDTAIVFDPDGNLAGRYDSVLPLPYDYDVKPGEKMVIFDLPVGRFGVTMCYEEVSYELNRYYVKNGVDYLVILTNHAYFHDTKGLFQTSLLSKTRAAESGIYALRATNTGITQVVSPTGVVLNKLPKKKKAYLIQEIYIRTE